MKLFTWARVADIAKDVFLLALVVTSLLLNRQLWLADPTEVGGEPAWRPPVATVNPPEDAFWPHQIYLHLGSGEHARMDPDHPSFSSLWQSTVHLLAGLDRDGMVLVDTAEAGDFIEQRMASHTGWQASFAASLYLDWWWEIWREDLVDSDPRVFTLSSIPDFPEPVRDSDPVAARVERALVGVDRILVFYEGDSDLSVFLGDGERWLATAISLPPGDKVILSWQSQVLDLGRELSVYRSVPPVWMDVAISSTVLVPDQDVYRPLFTYLEPAGPPSWETIKTFFLDQRLIREVTLEGLIGYMDGRQAVRVHPSGAIGYVSGFSPDNGAVWGWRGAVSEASWFVDLHGGWPDGGRVTGVYAPLGGDFEEIARREIAAAMEQSSDFTEYLAGGPWPYEIWNQAGGMGMTYSPMVSGILLESLRAPLDVAVGSRGLLNFTRYVPPVSGIAPEARAKTPFGAIADAISQMSPDEKDGRMVTSVYPAYFVPSITMEADHLTAVWVVGFADGEKFYIHAANGNLLGRGR